MRRAFALLLLAGCADFTATPSTQSAFGHAPVELSSPRLALDAEVPPAVVVGGVPAYDVAVLDEHTVRFTPQGHAEAGAHDVVVGDESFAGALTTTTPADPVLARVVAFGASITMGTESFSVNVDSQVLSPAGRFAAQAGAYLSLPLLRRGAFPPVALDEYDPATCERTSNNGPAIGTLLDAFYDPAHGDYWLGFVRVDPDMQPRNVAIGGARVHELMDGYDGQTNVLALVCSDPYLTLTEMPSHHATPQADQIEALDPTLLITFDLLANDFSYALHEGVLPELVPTDAKMHDRLDELFGRLRANGAEVFVANMPPLDLVPDLANVVDERVEAGEDRADVLARFDAIGARVDGMNTALDDAAAAHGVHVVDFHAMARAILDDGLEIGGEHLGIGPLEGLISLDGLHLTRTADAHFANLMIDDVNAALGLSIPRVDEEAVLAADPLSPAAMRAAGFHCPP